MIEELGYFVTLVLQAAIAAAVPVLMAMFWRWASARWLEARAKLSAEQRYALDEAIRIAVWAAEQSGLALKGTEAYKNKKAMAITTAVAFLEAQGIKGINIGLLADMIEAEVLRSFPKVGSRAEPAP